MYQKIMFDHYYCIKSFFSLENLGKTVRKVNFCITKIARKSMKDLRVLKIPVQEQRLTSS